MNNFRNKLLYLQCRYEVTTNIIRQQPCLVRIENLDNSMYTRTKVEVVYPIVYSCTHPISVGWVVEAVRTFLCMYLHIKLKLNDRAANAPKGLSYYY